MKVLVVDVGGTSIKILAAGQGEPRKFDSGATMTAAQMVAGVRKLAAGWKYDRVSIGYPGVVKHNQPITEPHNLAPGWVKFDYAAAFGCPVKVINDAAMQALGSHTSGTLLFLGLGTGLGTTLVVNGTVVPMEVAHLPFRKATYEDYVGVQALARFGKKKWRRRVHEVVELMKAAFRPDDVVLGGGNSRQLKDLPEGCRLGDNDNAFVGGARMWTPATAAAPARKRSRTAKKRSR